MGRPVSARKTTPVLKNPERLLMSVLDMLISKKNPNYCRKKALLELFPPDRQPHHLDERTPPPPPPLSFFTFFSRGARRVRPRLNPHLLLQNEQTYHNSIPTRWFRKLVSTKVTTNNSLCNHFIPCRVIFKISPPSPLKKPWKVWLNIPSFWKGRLLKVVNNIFPLYVYLFEQTRIFYEFGWN